MSAGLFDRLFSFYFIELQQIEFLINVRTVDVGCGDFFFL